MASTLTGALSSIFPSGRPAGLNVLNLGASLMFNFPERDAHRSGLQDAPVNKFAKGAIMRCFFHRLPTLVTASEAHVPPTRARRRNKSLRVRVAGARCRAVPISARDLQSPPSNKSNHGSPLSII